MPEDNTNSHHRTVPTVFKWEMVRKALKAAEEGVYCWEIEENRIYYTEQCLRMMNWPVETEAPNIFTEAETTIHEEDRSFFLSAVQKYLANPTTSPLRVEVRLLRAGSKGWKWVRVNGLLERDARKQPLRLVGVWVDITRRKMADLHAMEDRDLFRTLIDYLPDNIFFKNRESRFVLVNEATVRKMQVKTPADMIGRRDHNFFSAETAEIARAEELEIMRTGTPILNREYRENWKDRPDTWCRLSKFPWYAADGKVKGIVGIASDVTEMIEREQKYRQMAEELDVKNKILEKAEGDFRRQLEMARRLQRSMLPEAVKPRVWSAGPQSRLERRVNFHHIYQPIEEVAGDFFHVFRVGESGVGMLICDVMGHGVCAAMVASLMRGFMEEAVNLANTPALLLSTLNRSLYNTIAGNNVETTFVTGFYMYLDLQQRRLTVSGAGHPAPMIVTADGRAYMPPLPRSCAMGMNERANYRESEIPLESGMRVILYTDGLVEAENSADDELGFERVLAHLSRHCDEELPQMMENMLSLVMSFTEGAGLKDDLCMLGLEFTEVETPDAES